MDLSALIFCFCCMQTWPIALYVNSDLNVTYHTFHTPFPHFVINIQIRRWNMNICYIRLQLKVRLDRQTLTEQKAWCSWATPVNLHVRACVLKCLTVCVCQITHTSHPFCVCLTSCADVQPVAYEDDKHWCFIVYDKIIYIPLIPFSSPPVVLQVSYMFSLWPTRNLNTGAL